MKQECIASFNEKGYCVVPGLVDRDAIDLLLYSLNEWKTTGGIFYSQSDHNWKKSTQCLDANGLLNTSVENFTRLVFSKDLDRHGKLILKSPQILEYLQAISSCEGSFSMWQNMLFDKSTGTVDHIDSWYLDTQPRGFLIGAWVALEDIRPEGGAFCVYPGSHKVVDKKIFLIEDHQEFIDECSAWKRGFERVELFLKKGDVAFWHSNLIHGSTHQRVGGYSRKSLTAHYYSSKLGQLERGKEKKIKMLSKVRRYERINNKDSIHCTHWLSDLVWHLRGKAVYYNRKNEPQFVMDRQEYK